MKTNTVFLSGLVLLGISFYTTGFGSDDESKPTVTSKPLTLATMIVNKRIETYNKHETDDFLDLYDDEVKIYTYPDRLLGKGKDHLRKLFEPLFDQGVVSVEVHQQMAKDSYVINHETVDYGDSKVEYVSIYEVRNGKIKSVRFVRD